MRKSVATIYRPRKFSVDIRQNNLLKLVVNKEERFFCFWLGLFFFDDIYNP